MADTPLRRVPVELTDRLPRFLLKTHTLFDDGKFTCYGNIIILYSGLIIDLTPLPLRKKKKGRYQHFSDTQIVTTVSKDMDDTGYCFLSYKGD